MTAATPGSRWWRTALAALSATAILLLGGCVQLNSSMTISDDDLVSGQLLVSAQPSDRNGPVQLRPPRELSDRVQVTPYSRDGRTGSRLSFQDLSFEEVEQLGQALSPSGSRYRMHLSRSGSLVHFDASVDLTPLTNTNSSFQIEISAPGEITTSNGQESAGMVRWSPEPGEVSQLSSTFQFAGSGAGGWIGWAALIGVGSLGVVALVVVLAQRSHHRSRRAANEPSDEPTHVL